MKRPILIQGAERTEINYLIDILKDVKEYEIGTYSFIEGNFLNYPVIISETKVGIINASTATTIGILNKNPLLIINQGTCGSHSKSIHKGDIILGKDYIPLTNFRIDKRIKGEGCDLNGWKLRISENMAKSDKTLLEMAKEINYEYKNGKVYIGTIGSGDIWDRETDRILFLNEKYGTLCEEMETAGVYEVAKRFNIPVLGIRIVSNNEILDEKYEENIAINCQKYVEKLLNKIIENNNESNTHKFFSENSFNKEYRFAR